MAICELFCTFETIYILIFPATMKFENIHKRASHLLKIVEAWQKSGNPSRIERDIALEDLRAIYNEVADIEVDTEVSSAPAEEPVEAVAAAAVVAPVVADTADTTSVSAPDEDGKVEDAEGIDDDILDIDALLGLTPADSAAPATEESEGAEGTEEAEESESDIEIIAAPGLVLEPKSASEPEPTPESEPEPTPEPESAAAPMSDGKLFAEEDIPMGKRSARKIVSLYTASSVGAAAATTATATAAEVAVESAPNVVADATNVAVKVATPVDEQPKRLMDVLGGGKRVLADKAAEEELPTTPFNRITDLRKAIGINDKFLMIRDLFGGDAELYNTTIDRLNAFGDLDDCMIYIAENFSWNPDSAGAKLLVSLIERKLG